MRQLLSATVLATIVITTSVQSQTAPDVSKNVDNVARALKQSPPASLKPDSRPLYLLDVEHGSTTVLVQQAAPDLTYCGTPSWSADGRRIFFDASPGTEWDKTRMLMLETTGGASRLKDLGIGNCPNLSPDGRNIAFLYNHAPTGVWLMRADGTNRRQLPGREEYGIPKWSPNGQLLLVSGFGKPVDSRVISLVNPENPVAQDVKLAGLELHSVPNWAGDSQTLVSIIKSGTNISIALVDISNPGEAKIKQTLWRKPEGATLAVSYPVYSKATGQCIFVGRNDTETTLYSLRADSSAPPQPIAGVGIHETVVNLSFSPDGRYLLYCARP